MLIYLFRILMSNKFLFFLICVVNLRDFLDNLHKYEFKRQPLEQLYSKSQIKQCKEIYESLDFDYPSAAHNVLSFLGSKTKSRRRTQIYRTKNGDTKVIAKSYPGSLDIIKRLTFPLNRELLKREFLTNAQHLDLQFCPHESIQQFVNFFSITSGHNETTVWLCMLTNAQLILQPYFEMHGFPVPATYGICGFTVFQEHVGKTLDHFYNANFRIKLRIAIQLLQAALKFTNGFEGYRIYITDLTADNLVYNVKRDKLYFIDLNTAYIVDAKSVINTEAVDHHELIECNDCFAFIPDRLCQNSISDLNLLESCLFLREDLKGDRVKGFLGPLPMQVLVKYPLLVRLLDWCVEGGDSSEGNTFENMARFRATINLIELLKSILNDNKVIL
ncbi:uncharacterized protein LOC129243768 isoform X2 [Anastrepha obliqua]|nr:uncharacterized protein LOC129243768 isoform X2 [Anastrepha obliqua]XP_054737036.1 uncharacterized protein LOC129243768 isoform X2 [Anastrepha obliqua]XP_054737037.1 uncharacterized protein LOC129243768 isoform X2 [Anastrepha obliqua]